MVHALATALAALLIPASSVRNRKIAANTIAGVPILNYDARHLQLEGGSLASAETELDWVVGFSNQAFDKQLADFCQNDFKSSCTLVGHPEEHGAALVVLRSTEADMRRIVELHAAEVKFVEPDVPVGLPEDSLESSAPVSATSTPWYTPWNLDRIGLSTRGSTRGRGSSIYVFDTGVRSTHEQFGGRVTPTLDTFLNHGTLTECNGDVNCATDGHGHGTHCAGTAAGKDYGAAPEANIYAMKVCCDSDTNILGAIDWLAQRVRGPTVMTMSLGSKFPMRVEAGRVAIDTLVAAGVTVFVAAGNKNADTCDYSYGFIESAITVGATNSSNERAYFSSWGPCNDIYAPGIGIPSAYRFGDTNYLTMDGTSMATPLVAGVAALILEENPAYTPEEVRAKLLERAVYNALTGMMPGDPNILLYARPEGQPPTPVPPPPTPAPSHSRMCRDMAAIGYSLPDMYFFSEGWSGNEIQDGGSNMYDGGNRISVESRLNNSWSGALQYTQSCGEDYHPAGVGDIVYSTCRCSYPRSTWVTSFRSDSGDISAVKISGNLGADGSGQASGGTVSVVSYGRTIYGHYKQVYDAGSPSINQLFVMFDDLWTNEFSNNTDDGHHLVSASGAGTGNGLYVMWAGANGHRYSHADFEKVMQAIFARAR